MKKILIKYEATIQVSKDSWRVKYFERLFDRDTTLDEIRIWAMKSHPDYLKPNFVFNFPVILTEPEQ